jgi:hypothetical protein
MDTIAQYSAAHHVPEKIVFAVFSIAKGVADKFRDV